MTVDRPKNDVAAARQLVPIPLHPSHGATPVNPWPLDAVLSKQGHSNGVKWRRVKSDTMVSKDHVHKAKRQQ